MNVFSGEDAVQKFLDPSNNPPLPLVEIPKGLNPFFEDGVRIFAKCMQLLPLGNIKSLPAYNMLLEQKRNGRLKNTHTLIENSSGNTAYSLAVIGRLFGVPKTKAIVSHEVTWGKLKLHRFLGVNIQVNKEPICPDPNDMQSGIHLAKHQGKEEGWYNPGQYDNEANPGAHATWTAPQIWEQTGGKISIFCAGLGTTGTIFGISKYLKDRSKTITTVAVARKPNNPVPGVRTPNLLQQIAFDWKNSVDHVREIGTKDSFKQSLALCRNGLMAGPSSGFTLAGLLDFLTEEKKNNTLHRLRNEDGEIVAVFICPDGPLPYLDDYFEYLDDSFFPEIENKDLLVHQPQIKKQQASNGSLVAQVEAIEAYTLSYPIPPEDLWKVIDNQKIIPINEGILIVDVRTDQEFNHFHLPGSRQIELHDLPKKIPQLKKDAKGKKIIFVCKTGTRSSAAAQLAKSNNLHALNLNGGVTEWSRLNLPRIRPAVCTNKHP